jgi:3' terminal RNA ribose 2'-O-methyltransferase Hen1
VILTITCTGRDATDIGYLLHKNPASLYERAFSFGTVRVFYTEATPERCTVAVHVETDPVEMVRGKGGGASSGPLAQYVNDRAYVPSSFLSVALNEAFRSALNGQAKERAERVTERLPLTATLYALSGSPDLLRRLFAPLGYAFAAEPVGPRDPLFPEWGESGLHNVTLGAETTLRDLLTHLYVLVPVLDNAKHYFIGDDEVEKLLARGAGWLAAHPEKELITARYLRHRSRLTDAALERLAVVEEAEAVAPEDAGGGEAAQAAEERLESPVRLNDRRIEATVGAVRACAPPARRVIDLGCGEGKTLAAVRDALPNLETLAGTDVSPVELAKAARRLRVERLSERERERLTLFQSSLVYRDARLSGYDVALLNEVIEHLDSDRLGTLERVVFEFARPRRVIVTTPNAEYNAVWPSLPAGKFRHADHRFEWTRAEFQAWASRVAEQHRYAVAFSEIGDVDPQGRGAPTQMAVFDFALPD